MKLQIPDDESMQALGRELAGVCGCGRIILLKGDLGVGKTTLVRGFIRAFGYKGVIRSPTYTLVEPYEHAECSIYHFDLYRLADPEELEYLGARDYFNERSICLIEWPDRAGSLLPESDLEIHISYMSTGRMVEISGHGAAAGLVLDRLSFQNMQ